MFLSGLLGLRPNRTKVDPVLFLEYGRIILPQR
jgi:hypothetical protein